MQRGLALIVSSGGTPEERRAFCREAGIDTADSCSLARAALSLPKECSTPTAQPPVLSLPMDSLNIARNAARIALEIDPFVIGSARSALARTEAAVQAACALNAVESEPGFSWEAQPRDWESVCALLAKRIDSGARMCEWNIVARLAVCGK